MFIFRQEKEKQYLLSTKEVSLEDTGSVGNPMCRKILLLLKSDPMYPTQLAKKLHVHEQNVYYYIRKLESAGLISVIKQERHNGTIANVYGVKADSFFFKIGDFKESQKVGHRESSFLSPFIVDGELRALFVVGSPDPHGPLKARSKDGYFGMDLALFIGTFISKSETSNVKLDTEIVEKDLLENNLIVLGGPIVNKVSEMINPKSPILFDENKKGFYSSLSSKTYFSDEIGIISKFKSPFNPKKWILYVAGIRNSGTKSAILAFLRHFEELENGNANDRKVPCRVVEGVDLNSDGIVDDAEFLE